MIKVGIIGTRGIPNKHGGFERFVELLVADEIWQGSSIEFIVYGQQDVGSINPWTRLENVGYSKDNNPFLYYIKSVFQACKQCDIVMCCGVALSIFALWPVLTGRKFVINPDGCEWRRTKWSLLGRFLIRLMYWPTFLAAKKIVIDAEALRADFGLELSRKTSYIGYQAPKPHISALSCETQEQWRLYRPYVLVIARLEPENSIGLIMDAFKTILQHDVELIIVGSTNTPYYIEHLRRLSSSNIRFLGPIYDNQVLNELRSNCIGYIHGHTVGGTNPSLLEALATVHGHLYCHDNKYNREVAGSEPQYFGSVQDLVKLLEKLMTSMNATSVNYRVPTRSERYEPTAIALQYMKLFQEIDAAN